MSLASTAKTIARHPVKLQHNRPEIQTDVRYCMMHASRHLIYKNKNLLKSIEFHQLLSHLKGIALDTIKRYKVTGENYLAAWKDLNNRFDNRKEISKEYIRKFLQLPIIFRANFNNLRHLVDVTNQMSC